MFILFELFKFGSLLIKCLFSWIWNRFFLFFCLLIDQISNCMWVFGFYLQMFFFFFCSLIVLWFWWINFGFFENDTDKKPDKSRIFLHHRGGRQNDGFVYVPWNRYQAKVVTSPFNFWIFFYNVVSRVWWRFWLAFNFAHGTAYKSIIFCVCEKKT